MGSYFDKTIPRIKTTALFTQQNERSLCKIEIAIFNKHKIIARIEIKNSANEKLSLKTITSKLEKTAVELKINKAKWPVNDILFRMCNYEELKMTCQAELKTLQIIFSKPPQIFKNDNEKQKLLEMFHNDPLYGGHAGQKRLCGKTKGTFFLDFNV